VRFLVSPRELRSRRRLTPLLDRIEDDEYRRLVLVRGEPVLYGVREVRHRRDVALRLRILAGPQDSETLREVREIVERQFSAHLNLRPFYELARADPVLRRLVHHFRGMRVPQALSVFEALLCAILEQHENGTLAHRAKKALIEAYGISVICQERQYYAFPEPAALAIATPRHLRRLHIPASKASDLVEVSRAVVDGTFELEALRDLEPADALARLQARRGVSLWAAQYVALRALGHLDCLLATDVGLQKAIQYCYGMPKTPSPAEVEQMGRAWAGWRSYATFYLWLTLWEDAPWQEQLARELAPALVKVK